jgi:hypothetical protein
LEAGLILFLSGAIIVPAVLFLCYLRIKYGRWLPKRNKTEIGKEVANVTSNASAVADGPWCSSPDSYNYWGRASEQSAKKKQIKGVIYARTTTIKTD